MDSQDFDTQPVRARPRIVAAVDGSVGVTAALWLHDRVAWSETLVPPGRRHSEGMVVPALIEALNRLGLTLRDVDAWIAGTGPGSFTGLRAAIALVMGISRAAHARCRGIPSSFALARQALAAGAKRVGVLHDARRNEIIVSVYTLGPDGLPVPAGVPQVVPAGELAPKTEDWDALITAHGERLIPKLPQPVRARTMVVTAVDAAEFLRPPQPPWPPTPAGLRASLEPVYVRPPVFVQPVRPRRDAPPAPPNSCPTA